MLRAFAIEGGRLRQLATDGPGLPVGALWFDLATPTEEEDHRVEEALGIEIPTRAEAGGIQTSDRLVNAEGTLYLSAVVPAPPHSVPPTIPLTFVRAGTRLVTVRYSPVESLDPFIAHATAGEIAVANADDLFAGLLEITVDRIAERLERIGGRLDQLSHGIFHHPAALARRAGRQPPLFRRAERLEGVIEDLGSQHELASKVRDCVQSLIRLVVFAREHGGKPLQHRLRAIETDLHAVAEHNATLAVNMEFMLDATVGLIEIQQNKVIYLLSIVGVVLTPPVLVASVYGMNFHNMPELEWPWGYPFALGLMLLSAVGPYLLFKLRGWL